MKDTLRGDDCNEVRIVLKEELKDATPFLATKNKHCLRLNNLFLQVLVYQIRVLCWNTIKTR